MRRLRPSWRLWLVLAPPVVFVTLAALVYSWVHIPAPTPLSEAARADIDAVLRAALEGRDVPGPAHPSLQAPAPGPVIVGVWRGGKEIERVTGRGETLALAVRAAAHAIARSPTWARAGSQWVRLKVDIVAGRGPLVDVHPLVRSIALHPGIDGLGLTAPESGTGEEVFLLPDDMVQAGILMAGAPIKHVDFKVGLNYRRARALMARRLGISVAALAEQGRRWFRFRTISFVDTRGGTDTLPLTRGLPPRPPLTAASLRKAALAGGRYLVAHLAPSGRYVYEVDLASGRSTDPNRAGPYSIPRHAGTTYFLAELYRITGEAFLREPIERAVHHLQALVRAGGCAGQVPGRPGRPYACVVDRGQRVTDLGSTALTVVALAEYQRATGKTTYEPLARRLTEWILWMQRPDGSFTHRFFVTGARKDDSAYLLYYSGEAALALARMYRVTGERRYLDAAERALDHLVGWYHFFLGGFFYGEEHWTCIAAEAALPDLRKQRYVDFCRGYGRFLRAQQLEVGDFPSQDDLAGAYVFTPFAMPQNTPTGSRTESMISAYRLARGAGQDDPALKRQIVRAMSYALGQQMRPELDWFIAPKAVGQGAIPTTPTDRRVRIDYVQHVCSAMIRTAELLDESSP